MLLQMGLHPVLPLHPHLACHTYFKDILPVLSTATPTSTPRLTKVIATSLFSPAEKQILLAGTSKYKQANPHSDRMQSYPPTTTLAFQSLLLQWLGMGYKGVCAANSFSDEAPG